MARQHLSDVGRMLGVAKPRRSNGGAAIASKPTVAVQGEGEGGRTANNTILLSVYSRVEGEMLIALSTRYGKLRTRVEPWKYFSLLPMRRSTRALADFEVLVWVW